MDMLMFDTHKAVKALKQAGFDDNQAEAVVATVGDAIGENVATKDDILAVKADIGELRTDFSELRTDFSELRTDFSELRTEFSGLRTEFAGLRTEFADFKTEVRTEFGDFKTEVKTEIGGFKADIAEFKAEIYRHLWLMGAGIVGLTVTLVKLIP